ncbi:MAG: PEGA domain-containing protein [Minicystis sp.]
MKRVSPAALVLVLASFASPPAFAQTAGQAKRFGAAQKLYDQGAYTPAYEEFKALAAETGSPNAVLYVARCLRELGRLPEAYETMTLALRSAAAKAEAEPKYAQTRNAAAADLALLEPKVGKLVIAIANPPAGTTVTLDGAPLSPEKLGVPVAVAIGESVVTVRAPGRANVERRVKLRGGETTTLTLALEVDPAGPTPAPAAPAAPPPAPEMRGGGARIAGFAVLGVGAAGMATFAAAGVMANKRFDAVSAACGGTRCTDPSFSAQIAGGKQLDLAANIGLGVGIAGLVGGTLLVVLGGPKPAPAVTAWATPGGGGLVARGSF